MEKFVGGLKRFFKNEYVSAFLLMFLCVFVCFAITAMKNGFTLPMYGDYAMQTYAFYAQGYNLFWESIKTHSLAPMFDFSNFLGSNFYGTQSFYYLFSPLFYLLCLWPKKFLYQGILVHLILKYAIGGFFFYILLRKYFHVSKKMSWAGGIIYALSGWTLFYLWFHFSDTVAFFPLFLIGIEKLLKERKGWLLTLGLFLCGISNYFFLVNFSIFGFFYSVYRWVYIYGVSKKRGYKASIRWGVLFQGMLFYAAGIIMTLFVLFPSLNVATSISRTNTSLLTDFLSYFFVNPTRVDGSLVLGELKSISEIFSKDNLSAFFKYMCVWPEESKVGSYTIRPYQQTGYIISNWLFMNTSCWNPTSFTIGSLDNSIGGLFVTTPLTMLLIPCMVNTIKSKRPWAIFGMIMAIIIPFLPITMYLAFGFTSKYGRWEIWCVVVAIIYIIPTLDKFENVNRRLVTVNLIVNYLLSGYILYIGQKDPTMKPSDDLVLAMKAEMIAMAGVWAVYRFKLFKPAVVKRIMLIAIVVEIGISTTVTIEHKGYYKWDDYYLSQESFDEMQDVIENIQANDSDFYRIYNVAATKSFVNLPSTLTYNGESTFNSSYDAELNDFIRRSKMWYNGGWTMGYHEKRYYLDEYLGIKYYIVSKTDPNNDNSNAANDPTEKFDGKGIIFYTDENGKDAAKMSERQDYSINIPWGYELVENNYDYYDVYENTNYLGIGYLVNDIMSSSSAGTGKYSASTYEELYASTAIVEKEKYDEINELNNNENTPENKKINTVYTFTSKSTTVSQSNWDKYFSLREDYEPDRVRKMHPLKEGSVTKSEISSIMSSKSQFFHKRWDEKNRFGDEIILEMKEGKTAVCPLASKDNMCHINFSFKMGPRVLISLYNDDTLVTQDGHMVCTASLSKESYEWKSQRGFYVDQPINKIVIEFVQDTSFDKVFNSGGNIATMDLNYQYQSYFDDVYSNIKSNSLYDVEYTPDNFRFKANSNGQKVAVTNIPYDSGWTLKNEETNEDVEIFNVNGGFIGFIPDEGISSYHLSYFTPYLKEGIAASIGGLLLFIAISYIYSRKKISILDCETVIASNYLEKQEKEEMDYIKSIPSRLKKLWNRIKMFFKNVFEKIKSRRKK